MIGITTVQWLLLYLVFWLVLIAALYWRSSRRRRRNQWQRDDGHLFSCDHCHYTFINKDDVNLTRCPRCNSICIRRRNR